MGKKKKQIPKYLYNNNAFSNFALVTSDLFTSGAFQELSHASRTFYILLCVHKQSTEQSQSLYNALKEYYKLIGEDVPEIDLLMESGQNPKTRLMSTKFVIPQKQLEQYGYKPSYASKLKKELIDKGFIKVFANNKGRGSANYDFSKRVTIYEFCNDWKDKE